MKEYRQVPVAVELIGHKKARVRASLLLPSATPGWATPAKMWKKCCYGQEKKWINIAVCPCLHSSHLSYTTETSLNPIENKVWEIHIVINKYVSFVHWSSSLSLLIFIFVYMYVAIQHTYLDPHLIMVRDKKGGFKYHFWVFGMSWPGIEPWSPWPLVNTNHYTNTHTHTHNQMLIGK